MTAREHPGTSARYADVVWETAPGREEALAPLLPDLGKPLAGHDLRVRREDPAGPTIYTLKTNRPGLPGEIFVKVYRRSGVRMLLGQSRAKREWLMAAAYRERGLPTAAYLAWGVKRRWGWRLEEYLLQESLTSYEPFEEFFRTTFRPELPGVRPQDKRRLIKELAGLVRRLHDSGISRPALEPRNIMAAAQRGAGTRLVFVALGRSRLLSSGQGLSRRQRLRELAGFHITFSPLFSQSYRLRFYQEYFAPDSLNRAEFRDLVRQIVATAQQQAQKQERRVLRSLYRREPPFFWFENRTCRIFLRRPLYQNSLIELVDKFTAAESPPLVRVKQLHGLPPQELVLVKCPPEPDQSPRGSAARRAFEASALLEYRGVSHFRVLAAVEFKKGGESYYLTVRPDKREYYLADYLARRVAEEFSGIAWDRRFLLRLARFLLHLHELGWHFPHPSETDLWVRYSEEGTHELRLFNLHHLQRLPRRPDGAFLLRNLLELWRVLPLSQADGLMLAEQYLRFCRHLKGSREGWLRRFLEWQMETMPPEGKVESETSSHFS